MTTEQQTRVRAKPMSAEERRDAIVTATLALLEELGSEVSTRQIAQAAGIAEGTIFRVFPDKRQLFHAVLERVVDPDLTRQALARELIEATSLRGRIVAAAGHLAERSHRVMTVMMALRSQLMTQAPTTGHRHGPPTVLVEAQQRLQAELAAQVFAPHAEELRVTPDHAALVLRSLVQGVNHPGALRGDPLLTPSDIADVLLDGVTWSC